MFIPLWFLALLCFCVVFSDVNDVRESDAARAKREAAWRKSQEQEAAQREAVRVARAEYEAGLPALRAGWPCELGLKYKRLAEEAAKKRLAETESFNAEMATYQAVKAKLRAGLNPSL